MCLSEDGIVGPAADTVRIESAQEQQASESAPVEPTAKSAQKPVRNRLVEHTQKPRTKTNGVRPPHANGQIERPTLEQALQLRDGLRGALKQTRDLLISMRRDRKRFRAAVR
jgi:hypothetical protein